MTTSTISIPEQKLLLSNAEKAVNTYCEKCFQGYFSKEDKKDIVGNTMLKACKSLHRYNPALGKLSTWVSFIAVNCVKDAARDKANHMPISHSMIEIDEEGDECNVVEIYGSCGREYEADRNVDYVDFRHRINDVTATLDGEDRICLDMTEEGFTPKQIAKLTGRTPNAVSIRKSKMLATIKEPIREIAREFDVHNKKIAS